MRDRSINFPPRVVRFSNGTLRSCGINSPARFTSLRLYSRCCNREDGIFLAVRPIHRWPGSPSGPAAPIAGGRCTAARPADCLIASFRCPPPPFSRNTLRGNFVSNARPRTLLTIEEGREGGYIGIFGWNEIGRELRMRS